MYDSSIKSKFIYLRSQGVTMEKISEVMGINRTTLIHWNKEAYADIKIAEHDSLEKILAQNSVEKQRRVEVLAKALKKSYDKLEHGFAGFNSGDVLRDIEKLTKLINIEMEEKKYSSLVIKASKGMQTDFPIIIDDEDKYSEFDPEYVSTYDFQKDELNKYTEEEKDELRKTKSEQDENTEIVVNAIKEIEVLDMKIDSEKACIKIPDSELINDEEQDEVIQDEIVKNKKASSKRKKYKPAKRILNKQPDQNPTFSQSKNENELQT